MDRPQGRLYECTQCNEKFIGIKEYINHLDGHKKLIDNMPEPAKKNFFQKLFEREKPEDKKMKTEAPISHMGNINTQELNEMNSKIGSLERAMKQLSDMIVQMNYNRPIQQPVAEPKVQPPPLQYPPTAIPAPTPEEQAPYEEEPTEYEKVGGNKRLKVTVIVPEKQSGDFLKYIQESKHYEMEDITIHTRK